MKYIFIADEFYEHGYHGGAETCNHELIRRLKNDGHEVLSILPFFVNPEFIEYNRDDTFIIGNFLSLSEQSKEKLSECKYFIYEHDHKYLSTRDPSVFQGYLAPEEYIINRNFYKNSFKVVVQSSTHRDIMALNLNIKNIEVGMNLWSTEHMNNIKEALKSSIKAFDAVVMDHIYPQKNTKQALEFCEQNNWAVLSIPHNTPHKQFCAAMSYGRRFVFFPKVLETLSRVSIEANCLNTEVVGNDNISYLKEEWSSLRGNDLIEYIEKESENTVKIFES
jgi:hypothetical protein